MYTQIHDKVASTQLHYNYAQYMYICIYTTHTNLQVCMCTLHTAAAIHWLTAYSAGCFVTISFILIAYISLYPYIFLYN